GAGRDRRVGRRRAGGRGRVDRVVFRMGGRRRGARPVAHLPAIPVAPRPGGVAAARRAGGGGGGARPPRLAAIVASRGGGVLAGRAVARDAAGAAADQPLAGVGGTAAGVI